MDQPNGFLILAAPSAAIELGHTLRMLKLSLDSVMIAKGTRGMQMLGAEVNAKVDAAAAATADAMQIISDQLDA